MVETLARGEVDNVLASKDFIVVDILDMAVVIVFVVDGANKVVVKLGDMEEMLDAEEEIVDVAKDVTFEEMSS